MCVCGSAEEKLERGVEAQPGIKGFVRRGCHAGAGDGAGPWGMER